jgi:hypothetical protein
MILYVYIGDVADAGGVLTFYIPGKKQHDLIRTHRVTDVGLNSDDRRLLNYLVQYQLFFW